MSDGWFIPLPSRPVKGDEDLRREREAKIGELERRGLLRSERLRRAMLDVRREDFIPAGYRDHAYEEIPLPLPGEQATISCPHSYPLFYEPLGLDEGHRFLEVGVGSGYGTALAREVVGRADLVVAIDIDATTLAFARENLARTGHADIVLIHGDGGLGDPEHAPTTHLHHRGVPRCPVATDRAARRARPADRAHHRPHAPGTDPPRTCCTSRCTGGTASATIRATEPEQPSNPRGRRPHPSEERSRSSTGANSQFVRGASLGPAACAPWREVAQTALDFMKRFV